MDFTEKTQDGKLSKIMRIISGKYKGKKIQFLKDSDTRPLKDVVRENIFNILNHSKKINVKIENANVLDLYSGMGSFGLECLSRGAKKITFIEKNFEVSKILAKNLKTFMINKEAFLINRKIEDSFELINKDKFNIFFFDPPFNDKEFINNFKSIKLNNIIHKNHIVVIHREKSSNDELENWIEIKFKRNYGRSKIIFGTFKQIIFFLLKFLPVQQLVGQKG